MTACPVNEGCQPTFSDPRVAVIGTAFENLQAVCKPEQGILLLTDDAGLLDTADSSLGAFLSVANTTATLASFEEVAAHYTPCSCIYWDLLCFFQRDNRPPTITLGFVNTGETLSAAFDRITKCPVCALSVQTATCKADGSTWIDTAEYVAFTQKINALTDWHHHAMTYQASTAFANMNETTSIASQNSDQDQEWIVADYACGYEYEIVSGECQLKEDTDGNPIPKNYYLNVGLTAASFDAQHSVDDESYNYTAHSETASCHTGRFIDETTGDELDIGVYGQDGLTQLTGLQGGIGCPVAGAERHLNAFIKLEDGTVRYYSSLYVNGSQYGDVFYKESAIKAEIKKEVQRFKDANGSAVNESGIRLEAAVIQRVYNRWIKNNVINPDKHVWGVPNIYINGKNGNGEGYYIAYKPLEELDPTAVNCRNALAIQTCFRVNSPQHGSTVSICEVPSLINN